MGCEYHDRIRIEKENAIEIENLERADLVTNKYNIPHNNERE